VQKAHKVDVLHEMITVKDVDYFNDFREDMRKLVVRLVETNYEIVMYFVPLN
jgi:hypothetical protein